MITKSNMMEQLAYEYYEIQLRDEFAKIALNSLLNHKKSKIINLMGESDFGMIAYKSYLLADRLMEERK